MLFDAATRINVRPEHRRIGYVFQEPRLFPHRRVAANLRYGMPRGGGGDWDGVIAMLGIGHLLDRWPRSLSGGEARRVAIGRALLSIRACCCWMSRYRRSTGRGGGRYSTRWSRCATEPVSRS